MGIGVEIDRPAVGTPPVTPATELNWLHKDRLGSPIGLTALDGTFREKLAYDAWGKRRTTNGAPIGTPATPTPDSIDGITDNRGFTGHEMLDQLDLVHMNGRIYDPLIGRFLSADPILQDSMNGQSYNRYSYVMNNPTNLTDPTGFAALSLCASIGCASSGSGYTPDENAAEANRPDKGRGAVVEKKDTDLGDKVDAKGGGATIGPVLPTPAQLTIEQMKAQGGFGWLGAYLFEGVSKFAGTTGITTNQGIPYDYLANTFGCTSATCKDEARLNVIMLMTGFIGKPVQAINAVKGELAGAKGVGEAYNVANATKLADQLTLQSAKSPFTTAGTLTQDAINGSKVVPGLEAGMLNNPAIPSGFGKYTTDTFRSPAGDFQMHFYKNPTTGETFYGLDYKAIFNSMSGVPKKP